MDGKSLKIGYHLQLLNLPSNKSIKSQNDKQLTGRNQNMDRETNIHQNF